MYEKILSIATNYGIQENIFACVSDSGRDIRAAINLYPNLIFRLPCANHRLNQCVNDLFKIIEIKTDNLNQMYIMSFNSEGDLVRKHIDQAEKKQIELKNNHKHRVNTLIEKSRHLVGSFKHSDHLKRKLKEKQESLKFESRTALVQDVTNRWNSTYDLLDSLCCNMRALKALKLENDCSTIQSYVPSDLEFELIDQLCDLLLPLKDLTNIFAGHNYCTISLLMPAIYNLIRDKLPAMKFDFEEIESFREMLLNSLEHRFAYLFNNDLIKVCTMLDFQFKNFEFLNDKKLQNDYLQISKLALVNYAKEYFYKR